VPSTQRSPWRPRVAVLRPSPSRAWPRAPQALKLRQWAFADLAHREGHAIDASGTAERVADAVLDVFRSDRLILT
jgi:hypothetical protein